MKQLQRANNKNTGNLQNNVKKSDEMFVGLETFKTDFRQNLSSALLMERFQFNTNSLTEIQI